MLTLDKHCVMFDRLLPVRLACLVCITHSVTMTECCAACQLLICSLQKRLVRAQSVYAEAERTREAVVHIQC